MFVPPRAKYPLPDCDLRCLTLEEHEGLVDKETPRKLHYSMPGWVFANVPSAGNCFYEAVACQLNAVCPMRNRNWAHNRIRIANNGGPDGVWVTAKDVRNFVVAFPVVLALVHINEDVPDKARYKYVYFERAENKMYEVDDASKTPMTKCILRIAFTGNHYMPVFSEPPSKKPNRLLTAVYL
jgi:hypothetical protein